MRKLHPRSLGVAAVLLLGACGSLAAAPRVAVVPFDIPRQYEGTRLAAGVTDMITTALVKAGGVEVIERAQLQHLLKEQNLAAQGIVDPATAAKAGKVLGVDYIVGGTVTEFGVRENKTLLGGLAKVLGGAQYKQASARVSLDFRVIDASTGRVLLAKKADAEDKSSSVAFAGGDIRNLVLIGNFESSEWASSQIGKATRKAVDQVVDSLLGYLPATGRVLALFSEGEQRYAIVDIGAFAGIRPGTEYPVYRESVVRNEGGVEVWSERKDIGRIRVEDVQNERSKAVVIVEDPAMQEGDLFAWKREPREGSADARSTGSASRDSSAEKKTP